jgi:acetyl-CoA decarbonylase/synthase complex subunit delta
MEVKETYNGKIREASIGTGGAAVVVGGESSMPMYLFEGDQPHAPIIAFEVFDTRPDDWPEAAIKPYADVLDDPVKWALKCQDEFKADMICLHLASTNPSTGDRSGDDIVPVVKAVAEAVKIPLIVYGTANADKDAEVIPKAAEACQGSRALIGPIEEENYKTIAAAALGFDHLGASHSPIDVNIAKQMNILVTQLGLAPDRVIIDPTTGALGYGIEYAYSIMERLRLAAMTQNDSMTQMPIINHIGREVWKAKEAKTPQAEEPSWGDAETRGILWEAITAVALVMAGSNILVMRHPKAVELTRTFIAALAGTAD